MRDSPNVPRNAVQILPIGTKGTNVRFTYPYEFASIHVWLVPIS